MLRNHGLHGLIRTVIGAVALFACALSPLRSGATLVLSADGITVYDATNNITWLADFNLPASNRFGIPLCTGTNVGVQTCINPSGSMNYGSAAAWVDAMNAANYLGHSNWQLPTTPLVDNTCGKTGPGGQSFGFGCTAGALDTIYNNVGLKSPNTAVPIPANADGPFSNLQPYLYWSQSVSSAGASSGHATFSFATGWQGANTLPNLLYLWPMIPGKLPGTPAANGKGLQVNPGGATVYDPITNITWLANANLAATNTFGLPLCTSPTAPSLCVARDGAMTWSSASQYIANLNTAAYLGQTNWQAPTISTTCPGYGCDGVDNPMGNLFYDQLGLAAGAAAAATPSISVGPFHNLQPYLYWSCVGNTIQDSCQSAGPAANFEESYSFGAGFQGTDLLANTLFVTAYFVGTRTAGTAPEVSAVANAEGESPTISPNTWVDVKGTNLAPAGDSRTWQNSDFVNGKMPAQLDGVSVTVNGKSAFIYYISPTQVNVLTPPDAMNGPVQVVVTNNGVASASFTAQAKALSPSFFIVGSGPYVLAQHSADYSLLGPASFSVPGYPFSPTRPGETVVLYANGFGPVSPPVASGSPAQAGTLSPLPSVTIGGIAAPVAYAGINGYAGLFQFNVMVPANAPSGDNTLMATYNGATTSPQALITIQSSAPSRTVTFYVAPNGNDSWSGTLAAPNPANTDGPFATFDRARAAVGALSKANLSQVIVQFRGGTYFLPATEQFTAADSGTPSLKITYQNYPGETPVVSGGIRVQNWTNTGGNTWKATVPPSTKYFENLYYNGVRRLRPRVGGELGTYLRVASTIYLNAPAPPAAAPDPNCAIYVSGSGWECFDRFEYNPSDPIAATWKNLAPPPGNACAQPVGNPALVGDIELVDFEKFQAAKLRVSCIDTTKHILYLTGPTVINAAFYQALGFIPQHRYLIENVQDQLTEPGQWFLDRSTNPWTLTYLTNSGENPNTDTVIVPQLPQVMVASDLQYVTFQGLSFEHDNYTVPAIGVDTFVGDISSAVSFQNSQYITFDSGVVAHTSGFGLDFASCIDSTSPSWCVSNRTNAVTANNVIRNSAFYDTGGSGIRIGVEGRRADTDANLPQFIAVENNVVEGYGRVFPTFEGILQGEGHNNLYTHNDVYDGYHGAITICACSGFTPDSHDNIISFNHVHDLMQGIMNDGGSIRIQSVNGSSQAPPPGNRILNNKIHDVSDASALDSDGYGGDGVYIDNYSGLIDVENNLVYRVSGAAMQIAVAPPSAGEASTIKNNIFAFARGDLVHESDPYKAFTVLPPPSAIQTSVLTNNLFYFDRNASSTPASYVQGGCTYSGGFAYTAYQQWSSNLYWRTDGGFANDPQAFHTQPNPVSPSNSCFGPNAMAKWVFYNFASWQRTGEDAQSMVQNPGFANPAYPADDYSLPKGSPGVGFVPFEPSQAGRSNPVIMPPSVPPTFPTKPFNPATDY